MKNYRLNPETKDNISLCMRAKAHNSTCTCVVKVSIFLLLGLTWQ